MRETYARFVATADRLLTRFGVDAVLVRPSAQGEQPADRPWDPPYVPTGGTETTTRIDTRAVRTRYDGRVVDGSRILASDVRLVFSAAPGLPEPSIGDEVLFAGSSYRLVDVDQSAPGAVPVVYIGQGRA